MTSELKRLEWQAERAIATEIARGPWGAWVAAARKPKDITLNEAEVRLAARLGLPFVPKGTGVLSFGWVVKQLIETSHAPQSPQGDPIIQTLSVLEGSTTRATIPSMAQLVLNLMVHRKCIVEHRHNCFYYSGGDGSKVRLYDNHWTPLAEDVLNWAMLQSPFSTIDIPKDEWINEIHTQNGRLHNEGGPAVRTSKGRILYALNGVTMSKEEFGIRGIAHLILKTPNVEVRRVLIEDMGADKFIKESGIQAVHNDETGKLYKLLDTAADEWRRRHLAWVHVVCPSTSNQYMLAVPPMTRTAREGVAWTFRKLPEEYNPGQET